MTTLQRCMRPIPIAAGAGLVEQRMLPIASRRRCAACDRKSCLSSASASISTIRRTLRTGPRGRALSSPHPARRRRRDGCRTRACGRRSGERYAAPSIVPIENATRARRMRSCATERLCDGPASFGSSEAARSSRSVVGANGRARDGRARWPLSVYHQPDVVARERASRLRAQRRRAARGSRVRAISSDRTRRSERSVAARHRSAPR